MGIKSNFAGLLFLSHDWLFVFFQASVFLSSMAWLLFERMKPLKVEIDFLVWLIHQTMQRVCSYRYLSLIILVDERYSCWMWVGRSLVWMLWWTYKLGIYKVHWNTGKKIMHIRNHREKKRGRRRYSFSYIYYVFLQWVTKTNFPVFLWISMNKQNWIELNWIEHRNRKGGARNYGYFNKER